MEPFDFITTEKGITVVKELAEITGTVQPDMSAKVFAGGPDVGQPFAQEALAAETSKRKRRTSKAKHADGTGTASITNSAAASASTDRSVNIVLPAATYEWFEKQAAAADYEPSLAKYLQWQLRKLEKGQRQEQAKLAAMVMPADVNRAPAGGFDLLNSAAVSELYVPMAGRAIKGIDE